jgi:sugar phosphate isomerase/epimerase
MRLSCLPVSFFADIVDGRMTVADWARLGASLGLEAIDLSIAFVPDRTASGVGRLRREIESAGVRVAMLTSYPDFTHPDPLERERELAQAEDVARVAAGLGAQLVRVTAGQAHPETPKEAGIDWAVAGLQNLVERTRSLGVTPVYENHTKPFVWDYTDFSQPPDVFLEIVRRTADCGLGVNFDTANATAFSEDPLVLLEQVIDRVVSVHASDTAVRGALQMVLLGTGLVPFRALFARLRKAGFAGWVCMEEGARLGKEGTAAAAHFVRAAWEAA